MRRPPEFSRLPLGKQAYARHMSCGNMSQAFGQKGHGGERRSRLRDRRYSDAEAEERLAFLRKLKRRTLREKSGVLRTELRELLEKRIEFDPDVDDMQLQMLAQLQERHRWSNHLASQTHEMLKSLVLGGNTCVSLSELTGTPACLPHA